VRDRSKAFETLVDEHYRSAVRALTVAFRDPVLAERATSDAMARELGARARRNGQPPVSLYLAATRAALRRRPASGGTLTPASEPGSLERGIEDLPERERLALVLHHHAGLSRDDLARALRCTRAAASATLREAYRRLGVERDDDEDVPEVDLDEP
jgi:DNA-directed RNA polymerase specialized sigma24 family protein